MKHAKKLLAVLLTVCTVLISIPFAATAAVDPYEQSLLDAGWPAEYASKLTELHYAHPNWVFKMDDITSMKSTYTWSYIITQETSPVYRNLIDKAYGDSYPVYRRSTTLYDSGWYAATTDTVEFFMDPSNFLDEYNIFMFENLWYSDWMTEDVVESVLSGCFMSHKVIPDDGNTLTYAQYFVQVGKELNISPVHIASRLKQEQGAGTSPLISGTCGTTIGNTMYNGYYNYFNIGASGTGYTEIYTNGMKEAYNAGWNTHMKAIYGGASKLAGDYINDYQHTQYYQKFNIHPSSSRNFWGQYMQNISAPYSESRRIQKAYAQGDLLDLPLVFTIPVISGKPTTNANPGALFRDDEDKTFVTNIDEPVTGSATSNPVYLTTSINVGTTEYMHVKGWSVHATGVFKYQYSIDGGEYVDISGSYRTDVASANPTYTNCTTLNAFEVDIPVYDLPNGNHSVSIRGVDKSKNYYLITVFDVTVTAPKYTSVIDEPTGIITDNYGIVAGTSDVDKNVDATEASTLKLKGWSVHEYGVSKYQYSLNGGEYVDLASTFRQDVANANTDMTACTDINAFEDTIDISDCADGINTVKLIGITKQGTTYPIGTVTLNVNAPEYINEVDIPDTAGISNTYATYADTISVTDVAQTYTVNGWSVHSGGIRDFVYTIDGGEKLALTSTYRSDVAALYPQYNCAINAYTGAIHIGQLATGVHTITVYGKTDSADYFKVIVITLNIDSAVTDPYVDVTIDASVGTIDATENAVVGVDSATTAEEFLAAISHGYITDPAGNVVTSGNIGSGYILCGDKNGYVFEKITIIVTGDLDGDAMVTSKDVLLAKLMKANKTPDAYKRAADTDNDGEISASELKNIATVVAR